MDQPNGDDRRSRDGAGAAAGRDPAALFRDNLDLVRRAVRHVARRHFLGHQDLEDFQSEVYLKLVDDDYAVLRRFEGRSSLSTYLITVVQRAYIDFQIKRWGKWRPSAAARRCGPDAEALERLLYFEERPFDDACAILEAASGTPVDRVRMAALLARLPVRPRRRTTGTEALDDVAAPDGAPDAGLETGDRQESARRAERHLAEALARLAPEDRLLVTLAYVRGLAVSDIARTLGMNQRRLYRLLDRCLAAMRAHMESCGLDGATVAAILGDPAVRFEVAGLEPAEAETPAPRPSHLAEADAAGTDPKRGGS